MSDTLIAAPACKPLRGGVTPPGDKSISHRLLMLAALAQGCTEAEGFLAGEDNLATARILSRMGVRIEWLNGAKTHLRVHGVGLHGLKEPDDVLDAGNSGTCARLLAGILAGQPFYSVLTGDRSLRTRPMQRITGPLRCMGASIDGRKHAEFLPLGIRGGHLTGIEHRSSVASAQVKSCVLLAALFARGETRVHEPRKSRDHTERMMPVFGQPLQIEGLSIRLDPVGELHAPESPLRIPGDASSASFFAVAASLVPDSEVSLPGVGINPCRSGWLRILKRMGGNIVLQPRPDAAGEPVADLMASYSRLSGCRVGAEDVPDAIDEFPILFVAAALAEGEFVLEGAGELRLKESDRIAAMAAALTACGVEVEEREDGVRIRGCSRLRGGVRIDARGDHRIAMAMAVAAQCADEEIRIEHAGAIATSFPEFVPMAQRIGMNVRWLEANAQTT